MSKFILLLSLSILLVVNAKAQAPQAFQYQAVARANTGLPIINQNVSIRISIISASPTGSILYAETHSPTTNQFGLFTLEVGQGTIANGTFNTINWGSNLHFLKVEMDETGSTAYQDMGTIQLISVPYALHASTVSNADDADADPNNELQTLSVAGQNLTISGGNTVTLPGGNAQTLSIAGTTLTISGGGGNSVTLPSGGSDLDGAYDFGGAGSGRTINADAGPVEIIGTGTVTANKGRLHASTVGGSVSTPSIGLSGIIGTTGSVGFGVAGEILNADNPGAAITAYSIGTGQAISALMDGTGAAGSFQVANAASPYSAVSGESNGSGSSILGIATGSGRAGEFYNNNAANTANALYVSTNSGNAFGLNVENTAAAGAGTGHTIRAVTSQSVAVGIQGGNFNTTGTGIVGYGNNQNPQTVTAGAGGSFVGSQNGAFAYATTNGVGQALYSVLSANFQSAVRVNYWDGATQYKIQGTGTVSCVVPDLNGNKVTMHAPETPEFYYMDYGQGKLVNGFVHIDIDPIFAKNIAVNSKHPLRVYVQLEGDCNGVYVTNKTQYGFDVKELQGGTSNVSFQYNIVANAADLDMGNGRVSKFSDLRFEPAAPLLETTELESGKGKKGTSKTNPILLKK